MKAFIFILLGTATNWLLTTLPQNDNNAHMVIISFFLEHNVYVKIEKEQDQLIIFLLSQKKWIRKKKETIS